MDEFETLEYFKQQTKFKKSSYEYGKAFIDDLKELLEERIKNQRRGIYDDYEQVI